MSKFDDFDLDTRLLQAISDSSFNEPTLVQQTAIPLALEGKDILAKARTGSGKTAAYCIPVIQKIISSNSNTTQALILVPTRELSEQVKHQLEQLLTYCSITLINIATDASLSSQIPILKEQPHIVISTPSRVKQHLDAGNLLLENIESLVIDEADLILSYGYDEDVNTILKHLPQFYQSYLVSATLSDDVEKLKKLVLKNPAILELEESENDLLTQYQTNCSEEDKYLLMIFMLKLKVHPFGSQKSIIFVNSIDKCYKLKLFLEQFGIKSCTLNSELPLKSRFHILQEFNRGVYDYIIATDECDVKAVDDQEEDDLVEIIEPMARQDRLHADSAILETGAPEGINGLTSSNTLSNVDKKKGKKRRSKQDFAYGVSRGIDFQNVSAVINFDMPRSSKNYQHRVGRTARAGNRGYALSFVCPNTKQRKSRSGQWVTDESVLQKIEQKQSNNGQVVHPFKFDMVPVENFRYRCTDAMRSVTAAAIREARMKEIKIEILNSEKLKMFFEDNPADKDALRHDLAIHPTRVQPHMRHVPKYLIPKGKVEVSSGNAVGYVPFKIDRKRRGKNFKKVNSSSKKRKADPLKSFSYSK